MSTRTPSTTSINILRLGSCLQGNQANNCKMFESETLVEQTTNIKHREMGIRKFKRMRKDFLSDYDEICGSDIVFFELGEEKIVGYFDNSPIEQRLITKFNYKPDNTNVTQKPYRAIWIIQDSKLTLMYVNGIINGVLLYTLDIIPEYPDDTVFFHYHLYSGQLSISIQQTNIPPIFASYLINGSELLLTFEKGILLQ